MRVSPPPLLLEQSECSPQDCKVRTSTEEDAEAWGASTAMIIRAQADELACWDQRRPGAAMQLHIRSLRGSIHLKHMSPC